MQSVRYFKRDPNISNIFISCKSRETSRKPTVESFTDNNPKKEFSIDEYKQLIPRYAIKEIGIKSSDYSKISDILGMPVDELGRRLGIDNGSIDAYLSNNRDELRKGGDGKVYPTRSFYIIKIKPIVEQILRELK